MKKKFEYPLVVCMALNFRENIASSDPFGDEDEKVHLYDGGIGYIMSGPNADHTFVASGLTCGPYHGQEHAPTMAANYYQDFIRSELSAMGMPPFLLTNPIQNFINYLSITGCVEFV